MNINFHYAAIKVIALHAGFSEKDSQIVAYASQFVDDAVLHEPLALDRDPRVPGIRYDRGEFDPICTAHRDLDYITNISKPRAHERVYVCFHFLPGFEGDEGAPEYRRTRPDAEIARELVTDAVEEVKGAEGRARTKALIRLGIALHSYADTWAHQGFSGYRKSEDNEIGDVQVRGKKGWKSVKLLSWFVSYAAPDIGHAEAGTLPDRSDVSWDCKPAKTTPRRNNTREFLAAAKHILGLLQKATKVRKKWSALRPNLEYCLKKPTDDVNDRKCSWARKFKEARLRYHEEEWFEAALKPDGGLFDLIGDALGLDPRDYEVRRDKKFFYFHAAAGAQRETVLNRLPLVRA